MCCIKAHISRLMSLSASEFSVKHLLEKRAKGAPLLSGILKL